MKSLQALRIQSVSTVFVVNMSSFGKFAKVYLALSLVVLVQCQDSKAKSIPQLLRNILQTLQKVEKRLNSPLEIVPYLRGALPSASDDNQRRQMTVPEKVPQPEPQPQPRDLPTSDPNWMKEHPTWDFSRALPRPGKKSKVNPQDNIPPQDDQVSIVAVEDRELPQQQKVEEQVKERGVVSQETDDVLTQNQKTGIMSRKLKKSSNPPTEPEDDEDYEEEEQPKRRYLQKQRRGQGRNGRQTNYLN
ncbi:RNA polymerase II degradation factor 1-like [Nasonia vitripennis]|uniref:Uncharacterized protein n=1 Tax=Nasonia vitripennis TaxID=7425 RepID=A0A7M7GCM7_NASVI|nr:RNA polymerase II degradation factor 1-like [Nasonia vitripennis]